MRHVSIALVLLLGAPWALSAQDGPELPTADPDGRQYPPRIYRTVRLQGEPPKIEPRTLPRSMTSL